MRLGPDLEQQVEEIFCDALDKTGDARESLLATACAGSTVVREEVETLLLAYEGRGQRITNSDKLAHAFFDDDFVRLQLGVFRFLQFSHGDSFRKEAGEQRARGFALLRSPALSGLIKALACSAAHFASGMPAQK